MKQYSLTPISNCCKVNYKHRSNIPFEIHELIYIGKELILSTIQKVNESERKKLMALENRLDKFLEQSDYERDDKSNEIMRM